VLLAGAFMPLPYDYYTLLRIVVCVVAVYTAYVSYKAGNQPWTWIMAVMALIFNPIFKIHFSRETWAIIDLISAGIFGLAIYFIREKSNGKKQ